MGRWYWLEDLQAEPRPPVIGPVVLTIDPDGHRRDAFIVANPDGGTRHVLVLSCTPEPAFSSKHEALMFYGGFDPPSITFDPSKPASFLAFLYPAGGFEALKQRLGSIDFIPPPPFPSPKLKPD